MALRRLRENYLIAGENKELKYEMEVQILYCIVAAIKDIQNIRRYF